MGVNFWLQRPEVAEDKKHFLEVRDFPFGCRDCAKYHPNSRYATHNEWLDKDEEFFETLQDEHAFKIEIALSSTCNMTCMYCTPEVSTQWAKKLGIPPLETDIEWQDAMFESLFEFIKIKLAKRKNVDYTFLGGETLLEPKFLDVIEQISKIHSQNQQVKIRFITNANVGPSTLQKFIEITKTYPHIRWEVAVSIENLGEKAEAVREGLKFDRLEENLDKLLQQPQIYVGILPSWNALSITQLPEFHKWVINKFMKYKKLSDMGKTWTVHMNVIYEPKAMHVAILPKEYGKYVDETLEIINSIANNFDTSVGSFVNNYKLQLINLKNAMGEFRNDEIKMKELKDWYNVQQNIHNKNYYEIFPELHKVFDNYN